MQYGLYNNKSITFKQSSMDRRGEGIFLTNLIAKSMIFVAWIFVCNLTEKSAYFPESTLV